MSQQEYRGDKSKFLEMGNLIFVDEKAGLEIREGQIFQAATVKGGKNLIVTMRCLDGFIYYVHGDKVKKVSMYSFVNAVMSGDLEPKHPKDIDTERMSMATIGLDAIANRRTAEEHIEYIGEAAEARLKGGGGGDGTRILGID